MSKLHYTNSSLFIFELDERDALQVSLLTSKSKLHLKRTKKVFHTVLVQGNITAGNSTTLCEVLKPEEIVVSTDIVFQRTEKIR